MSQAIYLTPTSGPGSGTVTSITFNGGLTSTPDPITTTGTATIDQTNLTVLDGTVYWDTGTQLLNTTATGTSGQILTSNGAGAAPTYQNAPAGGITTIDGDVGSVTGSTVSLTGLSTAGATVSFNGSGTAMTLNTTDGNQNTFIGQSAGNISGGALVNVALGNTAMQGITSGFTNVCIGSQAMSNNTITGSANCISGFQSGFNISSGLGNSGWGYNCLSSIDAGSYNAALGYDAGVNFLSTDSSNVVINAPGTGGQSNTLVIGSGTGTGTQQLNAAFISGINGVTSSNALMVTINSSTDQLGVAAIPSVSTVSYTGVNHAASPYTVLTTDYYISADVTAGVITVLLPDAPTTGRVFIVKDKVGLAASSNITITTVSGAVNIDGATTFVMNTAYESVSVIFNGASYEVF